MIQNVTIPARYCVCDLCAYDWHSISRTIPTHCQNRECRSREWNGVKEKKIPERKPVVLLPKAHKVRGGNDDADGF